MNTAKFRHPGNILLTGFGLMLLMIGALVYFSVRQDIPLVSKQYYEQELVYQQKIDASSNAAAYGTSFQVIPKDNQLQLLLPPELAQHLENGNAWFYCPASEHMDRKVALQASQNGRYVFDRERFPGKGYLLKLSFTANGTSYYKEFNLPW
jgi:nitrogen fixation protein FixH